MSGGGCTTPVLTANKDTTVPLSLPADGGCYTVAAAETAVAALTTDKSAVCQIPSDFLGGTDAITIGGVSYAGCTAAVTQYTESSGSLAGLSIVAQSTCSALSTSQTTALSELTTACCSENGGNGASFCTPVTVDYSHVCEAAANYLPDHVVGSLGLTCDALLNMNEALAGEDFSSAYNCTSKSDAIKTTVNAYATLGCCGGNSNGKAILC